jgi:hypothetical protein
MDFESHDLSYVMCCWGLDFKTMCSNCRWYHARKNRKYGDEDMRVSEMKKFGEGRNVTEKLEGLPEGRIVVTAQENFADLDTEVKEFTREYDGVAKIQKAVYANIPLKDAKGNEYIERVKIGRIVGSDKDKEGQGWLKDSEAAPAFKTMVKGKKYELLVKKKTTTIGTKEVTYKVYELLGEA